MKNPIKLDTHIEYVDKRPLVRVSRYSAPSGKKTFNVSFKVHGTYIVGQGITRECAINNLLTRVISKFGENL